MASRATGLAIQVDSAGDIVIDTRSDGTKDFALIQGIDEIGQALALRLGTRLQDDPISPRVGLPFDRMVGTLSPAFIRGAITRQLIGDPRVSTVDRFKLDFNRTARVANADIRLTLIDGSNLTFQEVFGF